MNKKLLLGISSIGLSGGAYSLFVYKPHTLTKVDESLNNKDPIEERIEVRDIHKEEIEVEIKEEPQQIIVPEVVEEKKVSNGNQRIESFFSNRRKGNLVRSEGKKKVDLIREYSLKLSGASNCTGGFLDYEIPKLPQTYPKKGFIATNIHCILNTYFFNDYYKTTLPTRKYDFGNSRLILSKESLNLPDDLEDVEFNSNKGEDFNERYGYLFERSQVKLNAQASFVPSSLHVDKGYFREYSPKLVYAAIDFLGDYNKAKELGYPFAPKHYYKDFAVIEVNFPTEKQARRLTGNFYDKFDPVVGSRKDERINFFADELMSRKTPDSLVKEQEDFFVAGYPVNAWSNSYSVSNFDEKNKQASRLSLSSHPFSIRNSFDQILPGHVNNGLGEESYEKRHPRYIQYGNGKHIKTGGYRYLLENIKLKGGSSGSITTDSSRNLIGLNTASGSHFGEIEPIRSKGVYENGRMVFPEYDLIEGTPKQVHSYRSQIETYFLTRGIETNLSRERGGEAKSNSA